MEQSTKEQTVLGRQGESEAKEGFFQLAAWLPNAEESRGSAGRKGKGAKKQHDERVNGRRRHKSLQVTKGTQF